MKKNKIIIFDGTFKTTTFINRLALGLSESHDVYIIGFNENLTHKLQNVSYVSLGSNNSKLRFLKTSIALRGFHIKQQMKLFTSLLSGKKRIIKEENLQLVVNNIQPDIVHFQWVSVLSYLTNLDLPKRTKTVFSQRGFHINVRPFVDQENMRFLKEIFPKIDGFHSVSKAIQHKSNLIYQAPSKVDEVVYSGFDFKNIPIKKKNDRGSMLQIISVGRNHWIKDYATAIKAMYLLKEKGVAFNYTIIGVKNDEELLFMIDDLQLNNYIHLISKVSQQKVYDMMCASDVLLLPSIEEGIANVCIEAMFCKLPVISTNCGGMQELIIHKETGFIVPIRDEQAMAIELIEFNGMDKKSIETVAKNARIKAEEQHNVENMASGMEELYLSVINS